MPEFSITDNLGKPVESVKVDWTSASSLFNYLKSEALHLLVVPDFLARADQPLSQAAADPIQFQLKAGNAFQLGGSMPEIDLTPRSEIVLKANAKKDANLFDDDPFRVEATVPDQIGYVGLSFTGELDLGVSGSAGDLTFGFEKDQSITIEYLKAFPLDASQPTLAAACGQMISNYVIPAGSASAAKLQQHDICTVSGQGSLEVSGSFDIAASTNPLATVNLPLGVGAIEVQNGLMAGLSASLTLSGSYQIRLRKLPAGTVELSFLLERGTTLQVDLTASAGVSVDFGSTDLLAALLKAISKDKVGEGLLDGLTDGEKGTFQDAVKQGVDHTLQAAIDLGLTKSTDNTVAFQYEIRPELLDEAAGAAINHALKGDLRLITAAERGIPPGGTLLPGVKLLNSVLDRVRSTGISLKVNLLGIVNLISLSKLISDCEFLNDPAGGGLTIKETAKSERITAISDPLNRQESLRKAMFDSVMVTTTYRASGAVVMPELKCQNLHFAVNQNTSAQTVTDYLNWFVALDLMDPSEKPAILGQFGGGPSTCLMRTEFDDAACAALFLDGQGNPRPESDYLEIGRRALIALLDTADSQIDLFRNGFLNDPTTWPQALNMGPTPQLRSLLPIASTNPQFNLLLSVVIGDVYDIAWWARGMRKAGEGLADMRGFLAGRDPATLAADADFRKRRDKLQGLMLDMVQKSKVHFHEPWGMVCLFRGAGSRESSGKLVAGKLVVDRKRP